MITHLYAVAAGVEEVCEDCDKLTGHEAGPQVSHLRHIAEQPHHVAQQLLLLRERLQREERLVATEAHNGDSAACTVSGYMRKHAASLVISHDKVINEITEISNIIFVL